MPESLVVKDPKYLGKFIAVDEDFNIIGYSDSKEELKRELAEKGYSITDYDIIYVPKSLQKDSKSD
ncbi:hypothetical protein GFS03_08170 [Sulfolobus sp. E5-1-F]|uniref:DUF5678 domain-containing protein n=1 Tax=Saccharolobus sp. E5-1-F TaxID=2663019 RepID=UPI001295FEAF|nr:DUF5678 domain-containing protein [Sulfolobus sp. E5-1-F]QGA54546.1 hypothetical protein GFS03_08170 [Sulfolobus sp. E5-1-F]